MCLYRRCFFYFPPFYVTVGGCRFGGTNTALFIFNLIESRDTLQLFPFSSVVKEKIHNSLFSYAAHDAGPAYNVATTLWWCRVMGGLSLIRRIEFGMRREPFFFSRRALNSDSRLAGAHERLICNRESTDCARLSGTSPNCITKSNCLFFCFDFFSFRSSDLALFLLNCSDSDSKLKRKHKKLL